MDPKDVMRSLFCCMFPMRPRRRRRTTVTGPLIRPRAPRRRIGRGADRFERMVYFHSRANYDDWRKAIMEGISYDRSHIVVVWCPQNVVSNDFVMTVLSSFGDVVAAMDSFSSRSDLNPRQMTWTGTIVEYSTPEEATAALKHVPMRCRHIKIVPLDTILSIVVDCELLRGEIDNYTYSTVMISAQRSLHWDETFVLQFDLWKYGRIEKLFFNYELNTPGVVCRVSYPYLTHAYLAKIMVDKTIWDRIRVSAQIEKNGKDEVIIEEARKYVMCLMETYF